jgi:predicted nucleic acid-binding protein
MSLYLDANIFYHRYCPIEYAEEVDWLFDQLQPNFPGVSSEWSIPEMFRAFKKQVNLETISADEADYALNFFLTDIGQLTQAGILQFIPVKSSFLMESREQIFGRNLYAADTLHAITCQFTNAKAFITFDSDFKGNLGGIPIINPNQEDYHQKVLSFLQQ